MEQLNRPTDKQIAYLCSLIGGRYSTDAYRFIGQMLGISASAAASRATKEDASRAIDQAKRQQA